MARSKAAPRRPVATCAKGAASEVLDSVGAGLADVDEDEESMGVPSLGVAVKTGAVEVTVMEENPLLMGVSDVKVEEEMLSEDAGADEDAMSVGEELGATKSEVDVDSTIVARVLISLGRMVTGVDDGAAALLATDEAVADEDEPARLAKPTAGCGSKGQLGGDANLVIETHLAEAVSRVDVLQEGGSDDVGAVRRALARVVDDSIALRVLLVDCAAERDCQRAARE